MPPKTSTAARTISFQITTPSNFGEKPTTILEEDVSFPDLTEIIAGAENHPSPLRRPEQISLPVIGEVDSSKVGGEKDKDVIWRKAEKLYLIESWSLFWDEYNNKDNSKQQKGEVKKKIIKCHNERFVFLTIFFCTALFYFFIFLFILLQI